MRDHMEDAVSDLHGWNDDPPTAYDVWREAGAFSDATFGPPSFRGPIGALKHLAKEAAEAQAAPGDIVEYADCFLLVLDATRRAGFALEDLMRAALAKTERNKLRDWPDWRSSDPETPLEHVRK